MPRYQVDLNQQKFAHIFLQKNWCGQLLHSFCTYMPINRLASGWIHKQLLKQIIIVFIYFMFFLFSSIIPLLYPFSSFYVPPLSLSFSLSFYIFIYLSFYRLISFILFLHVFKTPLSVFFSTLFFKVNVKIIVSPFIK